MRRPGKIERGVVSVHMRSSAGASNTRGIGHDVVRDRDCWDDHGAARGRECCRRVVDVGDGVEQPVLVIGRQTLRRIVSAC